MDAFFARSEAPSSYGLQDCGADTGSVLKLSIWTFYDTNQLGAIGVEFCQPV